MHSTLREHVIVTLLTGEETWPMADIWHAWWQETQQLELETLRYERNAMLTLLTRLDPDGDLAPQTLHQKVRLWWQRRHRARRRRPT